MLRVPCHGYPPYPPFMLRLYRVDAYEQRPLNSVVYIVLGLGGLVVVFTHIFEVHRFSIV